MTAAAPAGGQAAGALAAPSRRPLVVTLVGLLGFAVFVYGVVNGVLVVLDGGDDSDLASAAVELALAVFALVIGIGALRMQRWAWSAFMAWAVIGLTLQILRYFFYGNPNYLGMAIDTFAVLALSPLDTQIAFGVRPPRHVELEAPTRNPIDRD